MNLMVYKQIPIGTITVDMHDQWRYISQKLEQPYKELVDNNKK